MQMAITFLAVVGGMIFSLVVAVLAEELIFGQVFRLFFARQAVAVKSEQERRVTERLVKENDNAGVEVHANGRWPRDDSRGCKYFGL